MNISWSVVLDENMTIETLKQVPIVLLPNAGIVSDKEVELLRRYVEADNLNDSAMADSKDCSVCKDLLANLGRLFDMLEPARFGPTNLTKFLRRDV